MEQTINVLCLHGCNQTQSMFESLMKNFIRLGEKQYNLKFFFTEGKYDHPLGGKTWYNKPLNVADIGTIEYDCDLVTETLDDIATIIREKNISVLFGFSQGANVVDTFLQHRDCSMIRCAVMLSGYALVDPDRKVVDIPVLTVVSESDEIVPTKWNPDTAHKMTHEKGHKLPTQNPQIRQICAFMKTQIF